jgi:hypothetical protein
MSKRRCIHASRVMVRLEEPANRSTPHILCRTCKAWRYFGEKGWHRAARWKKSYARHGLATRLLRAKGFPRSLPTHPAMWLAPDEGWYYGYGGYHGEPDAEGPKRFSSRKAADVMSANYDVAGPFATKREADAHLEAWFKSVEDES